MLFKKNSEYSGEIFGRKITIRIKDINHTDNKLKIDCFLEDKNEAISVGNLIELDEFAKSIGKGESGFIKNITSVKKPICIEDVNFKNGQIEDDGAYADEL